MNLHTLSLDEFLRVAHTQADSLTDTDIQVEALRRLHAQADQAEALSGLVVLIDEFEFTADELRNALESHPASLDEITKLLAALNDNDIHERSQLDAIFENRKSLRALASDAGDVFTRAASLIETAQEEN